jgi:hypothetical protein
MSDEGKCNTVVAKAMSGVDKFPCGGAMNEPKMAGGIWCPRAARPRAVTRIPVKFEGRGRGQRVVDGAVCGLGRVAGLTLAARAGELGGEVVMSDEEVDPRFALGDEPSGRSLSSTGSGLLGVVSPVVREDDDDSDLEEDEDLNREVSVQPLPHRGWLAPASLIAESARVGLPAPIRHPS